MICLMTLNEFVAATKFERLISLVVAHSPTLKLLLIALCVCTTFLLVNIFYCECWLTAVLILLILTVERGMTQWFMLVCFSMNQY